ncbi:Aste57867_25536 [Aphanomyces stellatus]|uniref:Aste57867_25536 protein n=1 Tax=Aphanomyces stellatus TaxID=120398 RepID=A0A485LY73_9STRA|nr:hypothetical protein As57867_025457 [Aphanomyces stellatus]VFU02159.1 Aste57867_25536 [Aphanomyces stellatus]
MTKTYISMDELPAIMDTRRTVVKRLLTCPVHAQVLLDAMVQNAHVHTVVAELDAFDGLIHLLRHQFEYLSEEPIRFAWFPPHALLKLAAFHGHLLIWKFLRERPYMGNDDGDERDVAYSAVEVAASRGHVAFLDKLLHDYKRPNEAGAVVGRVQTSVVTAGTSHTTTAIDAAAANAHLDVVAWTSTWCTSSIQIDQKVFVHGAARRNSARALPRGRVLGRPQGRDPTRTELDAAAPHGHLDIVKYLHHGRRGSTLRVT